MPREHKKQGDCEYLTFASVAHAERSSHPAKHRNCTFVFSAELGPKGKGSHGGTFARRTLLAGWPTCLHNVDSLREVLVTPLAYLLFCEECEQFGVDLFGIGGAHAEGSPG